MARFEGGSILGPLRWLLSKERHSGHSDSELLERFLQDRDETAFAQLMRRHGPLVLGVCKRVLRHEQDAEDVYQATFLILARKGASIRRRQAIGSWLYQTAWRLACKARRRREQQRTADVQAAALTQPDPLVEVSLREVRQVVDEELARLPDKYRAPLLLCYFEGRTRDEAASLLGWRVCTLKARVDRARELLRRRLTRRGLPFGSALITTALSSEYASCHVHAQLAHATLRAATDLAMTSTPLVSDSVTTIVNGAMREMAARTILKTALVLTLVLGVLGTGMGWVIGQSASDDERQNPALPVAAPVIEVVRQDKKPQPKPGFDLQGDPLPVAALARLGTQRFRQGQAITSLAWSPDGNWIASAAGDSDSSIRIWDSKTGKETSQFMRHSGGARTVAIVSTGTMAVSHDTQGSLYVWDTTNGKVLSERAMAPNSPITCLLALVGDGKQLVTPDEKGVVSLIETATLRTIRSFSAAGAPQLACLAVSKDGKVLATADAFLKIRLYEVASGKLSQTLESSGQVECLALSPDGKLLASGGKDKTIFLWETANGNKVRVLEGHKASVRSMAFLPDGKQLVSGGNDMVARLWDVSNGTLIRQFAESLFGLTIVAASPDGKRVAAAGGGHKVHLWETDTGKELSSDDGHINFVTTVAVLADGKTILTAAADEFVRLWDRHSGQCIGRIPVPHSFRNRSPHAWPKAVAVSADRKLLAAGADDGTIRLLILPSGKEVGQFKKEKDPIQTLAFSSDGKWLVSHSNNGKTWLWDVAKRDAVRELHHAPEGIDSMAFALDSKSLWLGSTSGKLYSWDTAADREIGQLPAYKANILDLVVSPDGKLVASLGKNSTIRVFDLASATELRRFVNAEVGHVGALAFSPDCRVLASGTGHGPVRLLEIASGQARTSLQGHRGAVSALAFVPDGKALVSGGADMTCLLWDLGDNPRDEAQPLKELTAKELETEWKNLSSKSAAQAYQSILKLAKQKPQALYKLQKELKPTPPTDAKTIAQWIIDLENKQYAIREKATEGLKNADDLAWPALKKLLENPPSLETQTRARQLLGPQTDPLLPSTQRLWQLRALELLEGLDTPESRAYVQTLAEGAPEAWLTREAKQIQKRKQ